MTLVSEQRSLKIGKVSVIFFAGSTARGDLTAATLRSPRTLIPMAKNLTLVVATPMRHGALPVVIINIGS